jgi:hypothetical protein
MAPCLNAGWLFCNIILNLESSLFISGDLLHITDIDSDVRLLDVKKISKAGVALELVEFQALVSRYIDAARECMKTQWFLTVRNIFLLVSEIVVLSQLSKCY